MASGYAVFVASLALALYLYVMPNSNAVRSSASDSASKNIRKDVVLISVKNGVFEPASWHSSKKPEIYGFEPDAANPSLIYAASNAGLFISKDGGLSWYPFSDLEKNLEGAVIHSVKSVKNPNKIFISAFKNGEGAVYETEDRLFSLKKVFDADRAAVYGLAFKDNLLYLGLSDGRLLAYNPKTKEFNLTASFGSPITAVLADQRIYVKTATKGIFTSSSAGYGNITSNKIKDFTLDNQKAIYAASLNQILKSSNLGRTWQKLPTLNPSAANISAVASDDKGRIFFAAGKKLYLSLDKGSRWQVALEAEKTISGILASKNDRMIVGLKN